MAQNCLDYISSSAHGKTRPHLWPKYQSAELSKEKKQKPQSGKKYENMSGSSTKIPQMTQFFWSFSNIEWKCCLARSSLASPGGALVISFATCYFFVTSQSKLFGVSASGWWWLCCCRCHLYNNNNMTNSGSNNKKERNIHSM